MKNLIVIAHPDKRSFCYNGIMKTIKETLIKNKEEVYVLDLYKQNITFTFGKEKMIDEEKQRLIEKFEKDLSIAEINTKIKRSADMNKIRIEKMQKIN